MINEKNVKKYCKDDISLIENYDKAIRDSEMWHCHHRAEILPCGIYSQTDLIKFDLFYNRPANELIFLTRNEHAKLHSMKNNRKVETLKKNSESHKGKLIWNKGKHHSEETKKKLSEALIGNKNQRAKAVSQYSKSGEFIKTFNSIKEAERQTGISHISACCLGKLKSAGGYIWRFNKCPLL